ncbi:NADH:ubiquinone reductase (Na(+)-transporting) subunit F [Saccharicrinis fermentans]|uniref:Na(+)-translocating NADH-quinone reductase subunit F n=1 Tax=Saccharicrinis fermentans DSM 9555 = JCM 21142 TaxID=869213 RepID=W7XWJ2_9BACT|nr:NADH:ubiquinone reductase (Na(+)-transporting) subunit F [Saccharicrinis fermentans]GAF02700.1 Na(+)-translocating NADH-quinone reductase subunit F [Saccharicrinis fermentans DSM 9555 = JCM 21142]
MNDSFKQIRDYSLLGEESGLAVSKGLAEAVWYTTPVPREKMIELLQRKNGPAIRDTLIWFGLMVGFAILTVVFWGSWWVLLPYLAYSVLYASTSDSRWHESSHGTAFKSDWMNNVLYEIASFMVFRQSTVWRYSHTRHHSDTLVRGRDPEISVPRPPDILGIILNFWGLKAMPSEMRKIWIHASGKIDKEVATYLPEYEHEKVILKARIYLAIYLVVILMSIFLATPLPIMFIGLPVIFGSWLMPVYGLTQHAGLSENVLDHRLNCRTVYMNRIHRFLYWNMNYHIEHHMFPLVPYHALPQLHALIKYDCPPAYNGIIETFKEIVPAVLKQVKDPSYFVERKLPQNAHVEEATTSMIVHRADADEAGWVEVCKERDMVLNEVVRVDCQDATFALYKLGGDQYYATEGICTHGNAHLADGLIVGNQIECAKHNGRFKIEDGSVQRPPVCLGLSTHEVKTRDGHVYLNLNTAHRYDKGDRIQCKVVRNNNVATFIKELVLEPVNGKGLSFTAGEYIQLEIPAYHIRFSEMHISEPYRSAWEQERVFENFASNHTKTRRNYSMANNPDQGNQLIFNVRIATPPSGKKVKAGVGSSFVFNLKQGDLVYVSGPFGDFHVKESEKEMVYIGGGAGMAPLRSHLSNLLETRRSKRKVSYWYGARSLQELYYDDYFKELESCHENFSFNVALSAPQDSDHWNSHTGFIHEVVEKNYLNKRTDLSELEFYLCGPPNMIKACLKMLENKGVSSDVISYDEF